MSLKKGYLMVKKIRSTLLVIATLAATLLPVMALPSVAFADIQSGLCNGGNLDISNPNQACTPNGNGSQNLQQLLTTIINYFSIFVGVIAVIMIIVGGLRYITSGGESGKVSGAKTTIMYALIGLVVVALAQLVVHFVLNQAGQLAAGG